MTTTQATAPPSSPRLRAVLRVSTASVAVATPPVPPYARRSAAIRMRAHAYMLEAACALIIE